MTDQPTPSEDCQELRKAFQKVERRELTALAEMDELRADRDRLAVQIKAVRALHGRGRLDHMGYDGVMRYRCKGCGRTWTNESPCPTIRALEE